MSEKDTKPEEEQLRADSQFPEVAEEAEPIILVWDIEYMFFCVVALLAAILTFAYLAGFVVWSYKNWFWG